MKNFVVAGILFISLLPQMLSAEVHVLPTPKFVDESGNAVKFGKISVSFDGPASDSASLIELKNYFGNDLLRQEKTDRALVVYAHLINPGELKSKTMLDGTDRRIPAAARDSVLNSEDGYVLSSGDNHIQIFANKKTGVFYAVATLLQLAQKETEGYSFPKITIADYPSMKMRGISDDISRGQVSTIANFKKIIRFLAMYKMNVYMPYIENVFEFKVYPEFSRGRAPLTAQEVAQLDSFARLYHVEMIPIFETLGHMEDVLQKPEFEKYAEFPGAMSVNIANDSTYLFMKNLLSEIAPAFSSKYFNMAADESFDVGLGASKGLVDSVGIDQAHAQYYRKIYDVLKSLGKEVLMYGDIVLKNPAILSEIPRDITIVDWEYGASFDYPSIEKLKNPGFSFIVSPALWNFTGPFPNFYNSYANIEYFTRDGYEAGAAGVIVSTWNDNGAAELRELNYPGYAWSAECAWNPETSSPANFENSFFRRYFRTESDLPRIIYELLSSTSNQISWYEFWRAPFIDKFDWNTPVRAASIESCMPEVLSLIKDARKNVGANKDMLDLYELAARINKYWADKVSAVTEIQSIATDSTMAPRDKKEKVSSITDSLLASLSRLKKDYAALYLRTNRHPMLQLIEWRFDDQMKELTAGAGAILSGDSTFNQVLASKFIYYPGSRPYSNGLFKIDSATFVKTIDLSKVPDIDTIQLIGDTYCKLFINGVNAGEVRARRTLTWDVEKERVRVFDISSYLHIGANTIMVQAINYDRNGSAGCNIFGQIGDDTLETDSTWKVARGIVSPDGLSAAKFLDAAPYDNGWLISAPKFSIGLKSWIER
ncbi:MAG TPA: family 20 glycosylhydrolase [Candidatus Acidoferrales bacterium]|nr:family 20 glycosylhydrolase [Candidatus Acidoferrales bacterium]